MSNAPFYAPAATDDPNRFRLDVGSAHSVGPHGRMFMMGGVGLGSAVMALEAVTERPLIWATAQYLSFAQPDSQVDIEVDVRVAGNSTSQARVVSRVADREIITVNAALGARKGQPVVPYVTMSEVPPPEDCPIDDSYDAGPDDLHARIERRYVPSGQGEHEGHAPMWIRWRDDEPATAGMIAILSDFLPGAIPVTRGSSSLDNTLRIHTLETSSWYLLDARIHGLASGFFHGEAHVFTREGTLLATASQSGAIAPKR